MLQSAPVASVPVPAVPFCQAPAALPTEPAPDVLLEVSFHIVSDVHCSLPVIFCSCLPDSLPGISVQPSYQASTDCFSAHRAHSQPPASSALSSSVPDA